MSEIIIRDARLTDVERLLEIYSYYVENTAITFEYEVPTIAEFQNRIRNTTEKYPYIVIEQDGKIEGYAYASLYRVRAAYAWCCEVTIYLDKEVHKSGLGRILYTALEEKLKAMGVLNLYACIAYPEVEDEYLNKNSAQFHEHLGYTQIGRFHKCGYKCGRWYDMIWMEKMVGEHTENPKEVKKSTIL